MPTPEKHRCSGTTVGSGFHTVYCRKNASLLYNKKWYCGIHHPPAVAVRNAALRAKWQAEYDRRERLHEEAAASRREEEKKLEAFSDLVTAVRHAILDAEHNSGRIQSTTRRELNDALVKARGE
jgi:hypothetical protein